MSPLIFEGRYQNTKTLVKVKLLIIQFKDENKIHFVYSPHLDLTGYGNNLIEARKSFEIVFEDFIDYTIKKKTIGKILTDLGWDLKNTGKKQKKVIAPSITSVIHDNDYVSEIFDKYKVRTYHQEVGLPVAV
jgi:hypothetical protein